MTLHAFVIKLRLKALKRRCDRLSDYIGTYCSVVIENMLKTDDFNSKLNVKNVKIERKPE